MKGLVKVGFTDKYSGLYLNSGTEVEFADARMKELAGLGYVELKNAPKTEPKVEAKEEPKVEKKTIAKAKPVAETAKKSTKKK